MFCRSEPSRGRAEDKAALTDAARGMNAFPSDGTFMQRFEEQQDSGRPASEVFAVAADELNVAFGATMLIWPCMAQLA